MTRRAVSTAGAPAAIGPYSQGIVADGFLFSAGQAALDPLTADLVAGGIEPETERVMANLTAVLDAAGASWGDVVKTTIFLVDMADFAVVNGIYGRFVTIRRRRARRSVWPPCRRARGSRSRSSRGSVDTPDGPPLRCADPLMTADRFAPGLDGPGRDNRPTTVAQRRRPS